MTLSLSTLISKCKLKREKRLYLIKNLIRYKKFHRVISQALCQFIKIREKNNTPKYNFSEHFAPKTYPKTGSQSVTLQDDSLAIIKEVVNRSYFMYRDRLNKRQDWSQRNDLSCCWKSHLAFEKQRRVIDFLDKLI